MSDTKFNEAQLKSLSIEMEGEIHLRPGCIPYKVYGLLNEQKIVRVYLRKCVCGQYPDKESLLNYLEKFVPKDGMVLEVHIHPDCGYELFPVSQGMFTVYELRKVCYCSGGKKRTTRRQDYI